MIRGSKMSKSIGNVVRVDDLLARYSSDELRMLCLLTHYRDSFNYDDEVFARACNTVRRFRDFFEGYKAFAAVWAANGNAVMYGTEESTLATDISRAKDACASKFADDFDTPGALAVLLDLVASANRCVVLLHMFEMICFHSSRSCWSKLALVRTLRFSL